MTQHKPRQPIPGPPLVRATSRGIDWTAVGIMLVAVALVAAALYLSLPQGVAP